MSVLSGLSVANLSAQESDPFAMSLDELLNAPVDVGTRRADRTRARFLVPVESFTGHQLVNTGFQDLGLALQRLSPSVNRPQPAFGDGTDHVPPMTLRGLEPDQTLVLINGKRLHQSALVHLNGTIGRGSQAVDLQTIPMESIEKVEILKDGAAAQYGSDAIAGIINIVLRQDIEWQLDVHTGIAEEGDDEQVKLAISGGWQLQDNGFVRMSLSLFDDKDTNRSSPDPRPQYFDGDPRNDDPDLQNPLNHRYGQADADLLSFSFNSELALNENWQGYAFGHWHSRESNAAGFFRRPRDNRNVRAIYPDGFLPQIVPEITDISLSTGMRTNQDDGWQWDINHTWGSNNLDYQVINSVNASLGAESPTEFDIGELKYAQNILYINARKQISDAWFVAFGGEIRYEQYQIEAGEPASYINGGVPILDGPNLGSPASAGSQVLPGFQPQNEVDESRINYAFYIDTEVDINDNWQGQFALRGEDNEDFGSSLDFKFATGYAISDDFFLRFSTSTGFKAPSLGQSLFSSIATFNSSGETAGTFPVAHPVAMALGAQPLQAEESVHFSTGFTWQVSENALLTVDWFHIDVEERIALTGNIRPNADVFGAEIVEIMQNQGVSQARFFSNTFDTSTDGFDIHYTQNLQLEQVNLRFEAAYHENNTQIDGDITLPQALQGLDPSVLFNRLDYSRFETGQPGDNVYFTLMADFDSWLLSNRLMKVGNIIIGDNGSNPEEDSLYKGEWYWDLDAEFRMTENIIFRGGIKNLTDNYPSNSMDTSSVFDGPGGIMGYSAYIPFGFVGRHYYLQLSYGF